MQKANTLENKHSFHYRMRRFFDSDGWWGFLFLLPVMIGFLVFIAYPMVDSLYLSLTNYSMKQNYRFVGLDNYAKIFTDDTASTVLKNTLIFTLCSVPLLIIIPVFLACALNQKIHGVRFFRAVYFVPTMISMVATGIIWQWMFNAEFGIINYFLSLIGVKGPAWLTSKPWALIAVIITNVWKTLGYNMMLFLAGLQNVPSMYYEAAALDGVNIWTRFRHITWPLLKPTTLFVTIMTISSSFQVFDTIVVMTSGGPARSSSVLVHYIYKCAFKFYKMGYACSLGWMLAAIIIVITAFQFKADNRFSID